MARFFINSQSTSEQQIAELFRFKKCERIIRIYQITYLLVAGGIGAFSTYIAVIKLTIVLLILERFTILV